MTNLGRMSNVAALGESQCGLLDDLLAMAPAHPHQLVVADAHTRIRPLAEHVDVLVRQVAIFVADLYRQ